MIVKRPFSLGFLIFSPPQRGLKKSEIQIVECCLFLSGLNERLLEVDSLFWRGGKKKKSSFMV